jgi:hypothetical protein
MSPTEAERGKLVADIVERYLRHAGAIEVPA